LSDISYFKFARLTMLSRPAKNRVIYRAMIRQRPASIVEIGMGDGQRALRMIELARDLHPSSRVRYAGIDAFEARPNPTLRLKQAHQRFAATGARVLLAPGDPHAALARIANSLANTDLVVVSADVDAAALEQAWFFVPRMLNARSLVLIEETQGARSGFRELGRDELHKLAACRQRRHSAAPGKVGKAA